MPTYALVTSRGNGKILKYNLTTGAYVGVFASGLSQPTGMVIGPDGKVYVANNGTSVRSVVRYNTDGTNQTTFASANDSNDTLLFGNMVFDSNGKLYLANTNNNNVYHFNADGSDAGVFATGNGLTSPSDLKIGNDGKFYVVSRALGSGAILRFTSTGTFDQSFLSVTEPFALIHDTNSNWYVATTTQTVLQYNGSGSFLGYFATAGLYGKPVSLQIAPDGTLLVGNSLGIVTGTPDRYYGSSVLAYDGTSGAFESIFLSGGLLDGPYVIAFV